MEDKVMIFLLDAVNCISGEETESYSKTDKYHYACGCIDMANKVGVIGDKLAEVFECMAMDKLEEK